MTLDTAFTRSAGILLHPSSLPAPYGIGDLGPGAYAWIDALSRMGQKWWQILPLGPTGFGDSPYQCFSAFAGNPYFISPHILIEKGLLQGDDAKGNFNADEVDYGPVIDFKWRLLNRAWDNFNRGQGSIPRHEYEAFLSEHASWLDDYALFMALKDANGGKSWHDWPEPIRLRDPAAIRKARTDLANTFGLHAFCQFLFFRQWESVRAFARERGIRIIGDIPIFVSGDSADVWANPQYFLLDARRRPRCVAGVPPDYFSVTGQLWGNPLYDWAALKADHYSWWTARLKAALHQVDVVRLDHFRGFESYWEIPAGMPTAEVGQWIKAPGHDLLASLKQSLGALPIIAEDLGLITPEVEALRDEFLLPGMRILQFAFGSDSTNRFLPHLYDHHTVVYTGTHDNDTTWGWFRSIPDHERDFMRRYLGRDGGDVSWDLIRLAWSSVADIAIAPLQDVMNLGTQARMNMPGRPAGNWRWRYREEHLAPAMIDRLRDLTTLYSR